MIKKYLRKPLSLTLALVMGLTLCIPTSFAEYVELYREGDKEQLSTGVVHENHRILTNKGWINLNVLKVQLEDSNTNLKALFSTNNVSERKALSELTKAVPNVVGSINTDFFDTKSRSTLGTIIDNGEYITTGLNDGKFASFTLNNNLETSIGYLKGSGLKVVKGDYSLPINYKNKPYAAYDRVLLYDKHWGKKTIGNTSKDTPKVTEILVQNGTIVNMQTNMPPMDIPSDGYVLMFTNKKSDEAVKNFFIGDPVTIAVDDQLSDLKLAMGGGGVLIKDGVIQTKMTTSILNSQPRTAMGITKDGKSLILVTIDGRSNSYSGVLESELGKILKNLGAYQAICFDGGGSTEMMTKDPYTGKINITNRPSDGAERRIYTGLAVTSTPVAGTLHTLRIEADDKIGVKDASRTLTLLGIDTAYQPVKIDQSKIKWSVTGVKTTVSGNRIRFLTAGNASILATYEGKTAHLNIPVQESLYEMEINPEKIQTGFNKETSITVNGVTKDGYRVKIHPSDLKWSFDQKFGSFTSEGKFKSAGTSGEILLKAKFDGIESTIAASIGEISTLLNSFDSDLSTAVSTPEELPGISRYELTPNGKEGMGGLLTYDFTLTPLPRTAALAFADGGIPLEGYPDKVSLWVNGSSGNGHQLRIKFMDSRGLYFNKDLATSVDWEGWRYLEADLPKGMKGPLKVSRIFVTEDNSVLQDTGAIAVDELKSISYVTTNTIVPPTPSKFIPLAQMKHSKSSGELFSFAKPTGTEKETLPTSAYSMQWPMDAKVGYSEKKIGDTTVITLFNSGGYIRKVNYKQWQSLLSLKNRIKTKKVLIVTSDSLVFEDSLEKDLFYTTLEYLKEKKGVKSIAIVSPNGTSSVKAYRGAQLVAISSVIEGYPEKTLPYLTVKAEPTGFTFQLNKLTLQ